MNSKTFISFYLARFVLQRGVYIAVENGGKSVSVNYQLIELLSLEV